MNLAVNPTIGKFQTSDGRWINFTMLQPGRYFADVCRHLGLEHLIDDERFNTAEKLMANAARGREVRRRCHRQPAVLVLDRASQDHGGAVGADPEPARDPRRSPDGGQWLHRAGHRPGGQPAHADRQPGAVRRDARRPSTRAPQFAEHTDDILRELGRSEDEIIQLKIDGAVT